MKKIIISEKILTELNISPKNKNKYVGHGGYQYAFQSSDPEKVVKFGRNSLSDEEEVLNNKNTIAKFVKRKYNEDELYQFQEMAKYPKYFPIIHRISKEYVILEKLDNDKAKKEYLSILDILRPKFSLTFQQLLVEFKSVDGKKEKMMDYFLEAHNWLEKNLPHNLVTPYYHFMSLVANIEKMRLFEIDINAGNFGYDKHGNLKMLDV